MAELPKSPSRRTAWLAEALSKIAYDSGVGTWTFAHVRDSPGQVMVRWEVPSTRHPVPASDWPGRMVRERPTVKIQFVDLDEDIFRALDHHGPEAAFWALMERVWARIEMIETHERMERLRYAGELVWDPHPDGTFEGAVFQRHEARQMEFATPASVPSGG